MQYTWVQINRIKLVHRNWMIQLSITLICTLCEILEQVYQGQIILKNPYPQQGHQVLNTSCKGNKIRKGLCLQLLTVIIPKVSGHNEIKCWIKMFFVCFNWPILKFLCLKEISRNIIDRTFHYLKKTIRVLPR